MSPETHRTIAAAQSPELPLPCASPSGDCAAEPGQGSLSGPGAENHASSSAAIGAENHVAFLPGTGPGGSIEAALAVRMKHIAAGHTPAQDAQLPDCFLENQLTSYLHHAQLARRSGPDQKAALRRARAAYVHVAALALALIDRIDAIASSSAATGGENTITSHEDTP